MIIRVDVVINGTDVNPYESLGLKYNPFPRIAKAEYARLDDALAQLEATPMPRRELLVEKLKELGGDEKFNEACLARYREGEMVTFTMTITEAT